jgi:transglutaminase-like putative cysteine protease
VCNWIHDWIDYRRGTSDAHTSACDTLVDRAGVCRDFAHLGIALCRASGIPARFISVYAYRLQPVDFHAVFEAWLGGRWYLFDPTRQAALDGLVRIGVGRDAAEVSFASINGSAEPTAMDVHITPSDPENQSDRRTTDAISIAAM